MPPPIKLYRHDTVVIPRPFGIDADDRGRLWEGTGAGRLAYHRLGTGEMHVMPLPELGGHAVFSTFAWQGKLVLELGYGPEYLVFDPDTGRCTRKLIPGGDDKTMAWFGCKLPNGKLLLCERTVGHAIILDAPDAPPRAIRCPFEGDFGHAFPISDGLVYTFFTDPARLVRFDPAAERFIGETPIPWPDAALGGRVEHDGVLYCADTAGGRMLPLDLRTRRWLDPIPHPDYGKGFGFIGGCFVFEGKAYYQLSTYAHRSRVDRKTGEVIVPPGPTSVDGRPFRFMEKMLVFDPATHAFDYLEAPAQPDGIPLLCYFWTDGKRFAVTGIVIPHGYDGPGGGQVGPWIVMEGGNL
jgi:hypothetical protein